MALYILTSSYHSTSDFAAQIADFVNNNLTTVAASGDKDLLMSRVRLVNPVAQVPAARWLYTRRVLSWVPVAIHGK